MCNCVINYAALAQHLTVTLNRYLESHECGALTFQPAEHSVVKSSFIKIFFFFRSGRVVMQINWVLSNVLILSRLGTCFFKINHKKGFMKFSKYSRDASIPHFFKCNTSSTCWNWVPLINTIKSAVSNLYNPFYTFIFQQMIWKLKVSILNIFLLKCLKLKVRSHSHKRNAIPHV